jgi:hypothetical protein
MSLRTRLLVLAVMSALVLARASVLHAQTPTLVWDANTEPDVIGYRVYYGTQSRVYSAQVDVGNRTSYAIAGLDDSRDYYFAVQAYASSGLSSALSAEITLQALVPPGTTVITSLTSNRAYPLLVGQPVTWTAVASSNRGAVQYQFWRRGPSGWAMVQDWSASNTLTWTPAWSDVGQHLVQVWARTVGSIATYEAWVGTDTFSVNAAPMQLASNVDFPTPPGTPVTWTASVAGAAASGLQYKFWLRTDATGAWSVLRDWASGNQAVWTPASTGSYLVQAWARRSGTTVDFDVWTGSGTLSVARTALEITSFTADTTFPVLSGTTITWTVRSRGGSQGPIQYQFWRYTAATGWRMARDYSTSNSLTWTPTWGDEGEFAIQVWARSAGSTASYEAWQGTGNLTITRAPLQLSTTTVFPVPPGTPVTWVAQVSDSTVTFEYRFWVYDRAVGTWTSAGPYGPNNTFVWTPTADGTYIIQAWSRRIGSTASNEAWRGTDYLEVSRGSARLSSLSANVTLPVGAGTPIRWTAVASGGTQSPLLYKFWRYAEGAGWTVAQDWSATSTLTWTPAAAGNYMLQVWVKSTGSAADYEAWLGTGLFTITP